MHIIYSCSYRTAAPVKKVLKKHIYDHSLNKFFSRFFITYRHIRSTFLITPSSPPTPGWGGGGGGMDPNFENCNITACCLVSRTAPSRHYDVKYDTINDFLLEDSSE
jgi:hypothetical protein